MTITQHRRVDSAIMRYSCPKKGQSIKAKGIMNS